MKVHDVTQRTPEWHALRCGMLTGTAIAAMTATVRTAGKEAAARRDLRVRLAVEQLTGRGEEGGYINAEMQRGIDCEPLALAAYEAHSGRFVEPVGFVSHDELRAGCSPDGQVGDFEGVVEVKCPKTATHIETLQAGVVPSDYVGQCQHALWLTGAQWLDFVSFDDRLPTSLQLFVVRMPRDEVAMAAHELLVRQFLDEVAKQHQALLELAAKRAA